MTGVGGGVGVGVGAGVGVGVAFLTGLALKAGDGRDAPNSCTFGGVNVDGFATGAILY